MHPWEPGPPWPVWDDQQESVNFAQLCVVLLLSVEMVGRHSGVSLAMVYQGGWEGGTEKVACGGTCLNNAVAGVSVHTVGAPAPYEPLA